MGNPIFRGLPPIRNAVNIIGQIQRLQNDPSQIVPFLKQSGRLTADQIADIEDMTSPEEIGKYLMRSIPNGMMGNVQNSVFNMRNQMK